MTYLYAAIGTILTGLFVPALLHAARLLDRGAPLQALLLLVLGCISLLGAFGCLVAITLIRA